MKSIIHLISALRTERDCHHYLAKTFWGDGIVTCPYCKNESVYIFKDGIRYKCKACSNNFTVKTNTFMGASKLPTIKWICGMWLIMHNRGISSVQLGKDLGVTQKTAWFMLQRLRWALGNEKTDMLSGVVEIDEAFIGGKAKNKHKNKRPKYRPGKNWFDKIPVLGMLERGGKLKAMIITDVLMLTLKKAVLPNIKGGSTIYGDGYRGYKSLELYYDVKNVDHGAGYFVNGEVHTNTLEGSWTQLKNMIRGSYVNISVKHAQKYVNEFVFRYNNRNLDTQCKIESIIKNMSCRITYNQLIAA